MARKKTRRSTAKPKRGQCKVVRGKNGTRKLCYTGKGPTGWQFQKKRR